MNVPQQQRGGDRFADYVSVAERVEQFYRKFEHGKILTAVVEHDREAGFVMMRAEVYRSLDDAQPSATGHAFEIRSEGYVNKTSYVENCETGAVGRALALLGFEVRRGIASREEMESAARSGGQDAQLARATPLRPVPGGDEETRIRQELVETCKALGYDEKKQKAALTKLAQKKTIEEKRAALDSMKKLLAQQAGNAHFDERDEAARLRHSITAEFARQQWDENDQARYLKDFGGPLDKLTLDQLIAVADDLGLNGKK